MYRCGKHVVIIFVGQTAQTRFECFESCDEAVEDSRVHQSRRIVEPRSIELWAVTDNSVDPFFVDPRGPLRAQKTGAG